MSLEHKLTWVIVYCSLIIELRVMLTSVLGALVKESKRENFVLRMLYFILLKNWLYKFKKNFIILNFLN
jgi:hypothetical protein